MQYRFGDKFKFFPAFLLVCFLLIPSFAMAGHGDAKPVKKGILVAAFGSSMPETKPAFAAIDKAVKEAFPGVPVRWAYSSAIIRNILAKEGRGVDSPVMAMTRMMDEGFTHVAVQSLHTIPGEEFEGIYDTVKRFEGMPKGMSKVTVGKPLLYSDDDMRRAVKAIIANIPKDRKAKDAVVLMGHGTHHAANIYYPASQDYFSKVDPKIFVGTVEGAPSLDEVKELLKKSKAKKVYLMPYMSVAGDHARNDMAGDEADSWKSELSKLGYKCVPVLKGTAEFPQVLDIWVDHLKVAFKHLGDH
ncbi:sirohydrochlorin cobaltochelatase [Maridesulfovibrio salexigens]|uniref:Sirohydrochlorin cobaltochelatase n=1 Tax=Maridesulfovibrio salexigens (strain ATCC 14822 / DSM 2638 / NCIMB 8403 / VKM B-1763) TaxID=526222 RepID=C6BWT3_MARSD|nr:sirohydrochlorin cobaltochelatase [Maridesulfovibrio salexigens]ACS80363.1 Sirohydrochlorin cobaltochelatase [Maridesulfovibrio salexigens DSM 2638]